MVKRGKGDRWEDLVKLYQGFPESRRWVGPLVEVADTMDACRVWFETNELPYNNADLVAMTRMVLERFDAERRRDDELTREANSDG